jgi:aspartyl-tRNA(Asn)/glutamyl-tRNA(Gln) amidotransferase subunit A
MDWKNALSPGPGLDRWKRTAIERGDRLGCFLQFDPALGVRETAAVAGAGPAAKSAPLGIELAGLPFAVKDNIAVRSFQLTCGSKILDGFVSPYTATCVARLQEAGAVVAGKTNLDEFGMGSSTENSAYQETRNPWDLARVPGGSSGGSAAAVAAGIVPFALGTDTGGSVRQPASFCGVYGLKPTYGAVSRYGLVAYASSLEVLGIVSKNVATLEAVFQAVRGQDPRDQSSLPWTPAPRASGRWRIGVPRECAGVPMHPDVQKCLEATRARLEDLGCTVEEVPFPTLAHVVSSYYVIATAEASANLARFDGVRYGARAPNTENPEALMTATRNAGFGDEVKLRVLLGTYVLRSGFQDEYYLRAQRIRTAIRNDFARAFGGVDLILMPVYPLPPFVRGSTEADPFTQKLADIFTCSANLAGLPALSFPAGVENGLPVGMQFLAPAFAEDRLFDACRELEKSFPSPDPPAFPAEWR